MVPCASQERQRPAQGWLAMAAIGLAAVIGSAPAQQGGRPPGSEGGGDSIAVQQQRLAEVERQLERLERQLRSAGAASGPEAEAVATARRATRRAVESLRGAMAQRRGAPSEFSALEEPGQRPQDNPRIGPARLAR